jgi:hypothetical protein
LWNTGISTIGNVFDIKVLITKVNEQFQFRLYKKSCNIRFYEVRPIIYALFEKNFRGIETNYIRKEVNEITNFTHWIFGLYTSFKLFDILNLSSKQIQNLYLQQIEYFNKSDYIAEITELVNNVESYYLFNTSTGKEENKIKYKTLNDKIKWIFYKAFDEIGLTFNIGREKDNELSSISYISKLQAYKFQQIRYYSPSNTTYEKDGREYFKQNCNTLCENDDFFYWCKSNKETRLYPKIPLYTFESVRNINNKSIDSNLLRYYNTTFANDNETIDELIDYFIPNDPLVEGLQEINKGISILNTYEFVEDDEDIEVILDDDEKLAEYQNTVINLLKTEIKDDKKAKTQDKRNAKRNEKIVCECGGSYTVKNKTAHLTNKKI